MVFAIKRLWNCLLSYNYSTVCLLVIDVTVAETNKGALIWVFCTSPADHGDELFVSSKRFVVWVCMDKFSSWAFFFFYLKLQREKVKHFFLLLHFISPHIFSATGYFAVLRRIWNISEICWPRLHYNSTEREIMRKESTMKTYILIVLYQLLRAATFHDLIAQFMWPQFTWL